MDKVYIVTSGYYSDYSIERVFLDKEKAEKYVSVSHRNDLSVEEYDITDLNVELENIKNVKEITYQCEIRTGKEIVISFDDINSIDFEISTYVYEYYYNNNELTLSLTRQLRENETENQATERIMKIAQDISAEIRYELSNGTTIDEINKMLEVKFNDEK